MAGKIEYICPVSFPVGWTRTASGRAFKNRSFKHDMSINDALRSLTDEIDAFEAGTVLLYTNYENIHDEKHRLHRGNSEGASIKITKNEVTGFIACDRWNSVAHNLYALSLAVRQIRMFEEWGIATIDYMLGMFATGVQKENAAKEAQLEGWMAVLGVGPTATLQDANAMYRQKAKSVARDENALKELNLAITEARKAWGG